MPKRGTWISHKLNKLCSESCAFVVFINLELPNEKSFYVQERVYTKTCFPVVCKGFKFMILGNEQESGQDPSNVCGMSTF
jgi:hypothetical protein